MGATGEFRRIDWTPRQSDSRLSTGGPPSARRCPLTAGRDDRLTGTGGFVQIHVGIDTSSVNANRYDVPKCENRKYPPYGSEEPLLMTPYSRTRSVPSATSSSMWLGIVFNANVVTEAVDIHRKEGISTVVAKDSDMTDTDNSDLINHAIRQFDDASLQIEFLDLHDI